MSKNYYQLYVQSVINLAQTLCIKSAESADSLNTYISAKYGEEAVDESDPTSWKYYMNVCGMYHPTDSLIYITSLDTQELIPFTKDSLAVHKATAVAYQFGTSYYNELVSFDPTREQLILGVLYPATMAYAVAASNYTILAYPKELVEVNEANVINKIQVWINRFKARWDNSAFAISDSLYAAANHAIMYQNLVPAILNIRTNNCRTAYAHSFHVRQFLASHGFIDSYVDSMTLEQTLWFYRNIPWVERNNGKQSTFAKLIQKALTLRNLPIAGYDMQLNTREMPGEYKATPQFTKDPLNLINAIEIDQTVSLSRLLEKETPLATGNSDYLAYESENIEKKMQDSLSSTLKTKVLESTVAQVSDGPGQQLADVLFNHWLLLSNKNLYNVFVRFNNPRTGEVYTLSTKDAFTYAIYAFCNSFGIDIEKVPQCIAYESQLIQKPTRADLLAVADVKYIDAHKDAGYKAADMADLIISWQPNIQAVTSTSAFFDLCKQIQEATVKQERFVSNQEDFYIRGQTEMMTLRMYSDTTIWPELANKTYASWLTDRSLPNTQFTTEEFGDLYKQLVEVATGADLNKVESVADLQRAMLNMLQQLSSYSIQFIADTLGVDVRALKWATVRVGNVRVDVSDHQYVEVSNDIVNGLLAQESQHNRLDLDVYKWVVTEIEARQKEWLDNTVTILGDHTQDATYKVNFGTIRVDDNVVPNEGEQGVNKTLDGYEDVALYTPEQLATLVDMYGYPYFDPNLTPDDNQYVVLNSDQVYLNTAPVAFNPQYLPAPDNDNYVVIDGVPLYLGDDPVVINPIDFPIDENDPRTFLLFGGYLLTNEHIPLTFDPPETP